MIRIRKDRDYPDINRYSIEMTKGDTLVLDLAIGQQGGPITLQEGDSVRFALSIGFKGEKNYKLLLKKEIAIDNLVLELAPEDTENLMNNYNYNYDIQLTYANGNVDTFIDGTFMVRGNVD